MAPTRTKTGPPSTGSKLHDRVDLVPVLTTDHGRWYVPQFNLEETPSRLAGVSAAQEILYRQLSANLILDIGQHLETSKYCINTAIVYMHRFYIIHSFTCFDHNTISMACIFLAMKSEEQPKHIDEIIQWAHHCFHIKLPTKQQYELWTQEILRHENIILQTLGFDLAVSLPHSDVVKCCQLFKASREFAQTAYIAATNSLLLTTMCLEYRPAIVACICIQVTCKLMNYKIPQLANGSLWFQNIESTLTEEFLDEKATDLLQTYIEFGIKKEAVKSSIKSKKSLGVIRQLPNASKQLAPRLTPENRMLLSKIQPKSSKGPTSRKKCNLVCPALTAVHHYRKSRNVKQPEVLKVPEQDVSYTLDKMDISCRNLVPVQKVLCRNYDAGTSQKQLIAVRQELENGETITFHRVVDENREQQRKKAKKDDKGKAGVKTDDSKDVNMKIQQRKTVKSASLQLNDDNSVTVPVTDNRTADDQNNNEVNSLVVSIPLSKIPRKSNALKTAIVAASAQQPLQRNVNESESMKENGFPPVVA